jgi:hypothetical protein
MVRWIAAAAAAGLLIGVTFGRLLYVGPVRSPVSARATVASAETGTANSSLHLAPAGPAGLAAVSLEEEELLLEVEYAVTQHRITELSALDALTPQVREVTVRLK